MNSKLERTMIDAIPDGMLLVNKRGSILRANAALQHMSGYTEAQMVGQTVDIFLPPDMRATHASMMRRYFSSPSQRTMGQKGSTLRLHRRDGRAIPIDVSLSPCQLDDQDAVLAFVRDLSQLRRLGTVSVIRLTMTALPGWRTAGSSWSAWGTPCLPTTTPCRLSH